MKTNKEKLEEIIRKRYLKPALASIGVCILGLVIMSIGTYKTHRVPKPEIYQNYQNTQRAFYVVKKAGNDLENISGNNLKNTIQELDKIRESFKNNLESMKENPELKKYNEITGDYFDLYFKWGGSLNLLGLSGMIASEYLCKRYKKKLDLIKK